MSKKKKDSATSKKKTDIPTIAFEGHCTIYEASDHSNELTGVMQNGSAVSLDLSGVDEVDSSFMQLVLCAQREAERNETSFEILEPSDAVKKLAEQLCCQDLFGIGSNDEGKGEANVV